MALVTDPSDSGFNALVSQADADTYHEGRLHNSAWTGADDATKEKAIRYATSIMLPVVTVDDPIPAGLANACAEYAFHLIIGDRAGDPGSKGVDSVKLGPMTVEIDSSTVAGRYPSLVKDMMAPYMTTPHGRLVRT